MNKLTNDFIAIDTNVFEHLFDSEKNLDEHIDKLLNVLFLDGIKLLVDDKMPGKKGITDEYENRLKNRVKQASEHRKRRALLLYYVSPKNHNSIVVDLNDELMKKIKRIIPLPPKGKPNTDRIFVYVAFKEGRILITNDRHDILDERSCMDGRRRRKLRKIPEKSGRQSGADILTSKEAYDKL